MDRSGLPNKAIAALREIKQHPEKWFRETPVDDRDRALLRARRLPWIQYGSMTYLRKVYTIGSGQSQYDPRIDWTVENDVHLKTLMRHAGCDVVGFRDLEIPPIDEPLNLSHVTVNVHVEAKPHTDAGFNWGFLSTHGLKPGSVRIFKGPPSTCPTHPWDAMILRNCTPNTGSLAGTVAEGRFDILCIKMCEDYDNPFLVVAVRDANEYPYDEPDVSCG